MKEVNKENIKSQIFRISKGRNGQALIEVLIATSILAISIMILMNSGYVGLLAVNLGSEQNSVASLAEEGFEVVEAISKKDWHSIYNLPGKGVTEYYPKVSGGIWTLTTSTIDKAVVTNGESYDRFIKIEDVNRDLCGAGSITTLATTTCNINEVGIASDPSTQKIIITVTGKNIADLVWVRYITRVRSTTSLQTDWQGGAGQALNPNTGFNTPDFNNGFSADSNPGNPDINISVPGSIKLNYQ